MWYEIIGIILYCGLFAIISLLAYQLAVIKKHLEVLMEYHEQLIEDKKNDNDDDDKEDKKTK